MPDHATPQSGYDAPATYDAAAADYERAAAAWWAFLGERTVERLAIAPGAQVLDVACGTGTSLVPAARLAGPAGRVVGVDLATRMLDIAREKVAREGLANVELHEADMTALPFAPASFDVVQCVLGVFFVPDMAAQCAHLWRFVRPGGRLAVTTLGHGFLSPMLEAWKAAAAVVAPHIDARPPWERLDDPATLRAVLLAGGATDVAVAAETRVMPLPSADAWWPIVRGTGLRRFVDDMGPDAAERVRAHCAGWAREHDVRELRVTALFGVATRPA